jgi:hypothetical protein
VQDSDNESGLKTQVVPEIGSNATRASVDASSSQTNRPTTANDQTVSEQLELDRKVESVEIETSSEEVSTGFAPDDPLDGRRPGEWKSRYPDEALAQIKKEAIYLGVLLFLSPASMLLLNSGLVQSLTRASDEQFRPILTFGLAWLGGLLGGTLFDIKWLYHVVARERWNQDRIYWRVFAPHISSGLAFATIALISSGLFRIFDSSTTQSKTLVIGVSFLVGYFSDTAIAKLAEIAQTIFGASRDKERHLDPGDPDGPKKGGKSSSE